MLLGQAERRLGVADKLAAVIADPRNPLLITHSLGSIFRARILAIACGYEDADDLDHLRKDPAFKLACGRLPDTGTDLCSQPTMSRWENAPTLREIVKLSGVLIDLYCASYAAPPQAITLDIDDTCDVAQLRSLTRMQLVRTLASYLTAYRDLDSAYRIGLKSLARRYLELHDEIADLDVMIAAIVDELAANLIARNSIGHIGAAQLLLTAATIQKG